MIGMDPVDPEFVHQFIWLIVNALLSVGVGIVVFHITHIRGLAFVCFAVFWLAVLVKKSWH